MTLRIRIDDKRFPQNPAQPVLQDICFDIGATEFIAVIGPSGCGKSTLLNIVAGLDQTFSGRVDWPADNGNHRLGYVFQNPRLLPWLTVRENIRIVLDQSQARLVAHVDELLEAMELSRYADYHPGRISVGMQRRVALARAFAVEPQLLLMDEPFVSLDAPTANLLRALLLRVWEHHRGRVLFVTHDLREATQLADRILFLSRGPAHLIADAEVGIVRSQRMLEEPIDIRHGQLKQMFETLYGGCDQRDVAMPTDGGRHPRLTDAVP